jgi:hypothetical protein
MSVEVTLTIWGPGPKVVALRRLPIGHWWREGDAIPGERGLVRPESGWALESGLAPRRSLEDHAQAIRALAAPHEAEIAAAALSGHGELSVALHLGDRPGETHLPADVLSWLAGINCSLDIDAYPFEPGDGDRRAAPAPG